MTKRILIPIVAILMAAVPSSAQCYPEGKTAADLIRENPLRAGNNHHIYEYTDLTDTRAPRGYKPFYISHYGRHGSRSDHMSEAWIRLEEQLRPAYEQDMLSAKGRLAYEKILEMCQVGEGMREMLTPIGVREHAGIARRMYKRFPRVFRGHKTIDAKSSTVQRCILSMASFTTSLAAQNPKLEFDMLTGQTYMNYIGLSDGSSEATKGADRILYDYKKSLQRDTTTILSELFKDPLAGHELIQDAYHFQSDFINTANYSQCLGVEDVFHDCIPFEECMNAWSLKNRSLYLKHCNSAEFGDRRTYIAHKVTQDIIDRADNAVQGNGRAADLRFGHDYPLMALVGFLELEGVGARYSFDEIDDNWFGGLYICMASNMQLIFYKNRKGDVLVKCLYNEKETGFIGVEPVSWPYYRWEDVRNRWEARILAGRQ